MNEWRNLVLRSLVCYRLARLVAIDEGPFRIFYWVRVWAGAYDYDLQGQAETTLGRGISCPFCIGLWLAFPLALYTDLSLWWVKWLAIAGFQAFLQSVSND